MGIWRFVGKAILVTAKVTGKVAWRTTKVATKVAVGTTSVVAKNVYDSREGIAKVAGVTAVLAGKAALLLRLNLRPTVPRQ